MTRQATPAEAQTIIAAATIIVFREGPSNTPELLMVQRSKDLSFAGAATVFPGGKVADSDHAIAATLTSFEHDEAAARIAGIREVLEETGLILGVRQKLTASEAAAARTMLDTSEDLQPVLDHFGWTLDPDALVPFARWLPKFKAGRIFDTRFYIADLGSGQVDLTPDLGENMRLFWSSATDALAMVERGDLKMIYPTRRNPERLAGFSSFAEAAEHARSTPIVTVSPWIERHENARCSAFLRASDTRSRSRRLRRSTSPDPGQARLRCPLNACGQRAGRQCREPTGPERRRSSACRTMAGQGCAAHPCPYSIVS